MSELLHIYGPFSIQSYGSLILLGVLVFLWRAPKNKIARRYLTHEQLVTLITTGIIVGIIGGRLLHVLSDLSAYERMIDVFKIWEGGFSILGTVIAIALFMPWYLYTHKIPILPILDLTTIYAPLVQSISRIGCFLAGCCYGRPTTMPWGVAPWAVTVDDQLIHPTQLYSSLMLLVIFCVIRFVIFPRTHYMGVITSWYLLLIGLERFMVDFWRADQITVSLIGLFSFHQIVALMVSLFGFACLIFFTKRRIPYEHL